MKGTICFFGKKYGFISPDGGGPNVFMHIGDFRDRAHHKLGFGDRVEFEIIQTEKGQKAVGVRLLAAVDVTGENWSEFIDLVPIPRSKD